MCINFLGKLLTIFRKQMNQWGNMEAMDISSLVKSIQSLVNPKFKRSFTLRTRPLYISSLNMFVNQFSYLSPASLHLNRPVSHPQFKNIGPTKQHILQKIKHNLVVTCASGPTQLLPDKNMPAFGAHISSMKAFCKVRSKH